MPKLGHSVLKWVGSLNSVDIPGKTRFHRFVLSARLGLWPAILLSSFAFGHLLKFEIVPTVVLSVTLCFVASVAFLFNDACDAGIDELNKVHRWHVRTSFDLWLFLGAVGICLSTILLASFLVSTPTFIGLIVTATVSIAYSLICKKIFLLGNVVAAALSISPGLIISFDTYMGGPQSGNVSVVALTFLGAAFLLLVSREIKFDEFDLAGDRFGNRTTLPMVLSGPTLSMVHALVCASALSLLLFILAIAGKFSWHVNLILALGTCGFCAALMIFSYRTASKEKFYKTTRLVMLVIPVSILLSF
jgi:4-hydroxybenzoate polyprenyltransferase